MTKLYSRLSDHETVLELWEASTKHPDSIFYFSEFNKILSLMTRVRFSLGFWSALPA